MLFTLAMHWRHDYKTNGFIMGNLRWMRLSGLALVGAVLAIRGADEMLAVDLEKPAKALHTKIQEHKKGEDTVTAIEYLADADCHYYPEAQQVLLETVEHHPREDVRYAAAKSLFTQLQRGRKPLNPHYGWREIPDPLILEQIARLSTFHVPLNQEEMLERYAERKMEKERKWGEKEGRGDVFHGCCDDKAMEVLLRVAYGKDDKNCFIEPSDRVRKQAEMGITVVMGRDALTMESTPTLTPMPVDPNVPTPPVQTNIDAPIPQAPYIPSYTGRVPFAGRADTANRFNLFDNMSVEPRTRVFAAYQFVEGQNNAIRVSDAADNYFRDPFFGNLLTAQGQLNFIQATGFGQGLVDPTGFPPVTADGSAATANQLRDEFFRSNSGRTRNFLTQGNTNLYRFGFEYAFTMDFSVLMQAQFLTPLDKDSQQPDAFSNPLMVFKHVLYRDEDRVFSALTGFSPEIPQKDISIVERTSRILPGLAYFQDLDKDWFFQGASGFSLPTKTGQVATWDYILGVGWYLYRDESLLNPAITPSSDKWLLGIVPQFEVLGKHIMGDSTVRGAFGLGAAAPMSALGIASSFTDASGTLLQPSTGLPLGNAAFEFEEPRHVIDITVATSFILQGNRSVGLGLSVPVTGGAARDLEFFTSFNWSF